MNGKAEDPKLPWGIYIPPNQNGSQHDGYIRVVDKKTKSFPCGYVRSTERHKRNHDEMSKEYHGGDVPSESTHIEQHDVPESNEKSVPEECLHPEEALFLCTRGLLRIQSYPDDGKISSEPIMDATMTTQELMNNMLSESNISMTAYLAYAHLREQGYNLMRYASTRFSLLLEMEALKHRPKIDHGVPAQDECTLEKNRPGSNLAPESNEVLPNSEVNEHIGDKKKSTRQLYKDDVANAPPPRIVCNSGSFETNPSLSYLAYNPNAKFKRTDPGLPDFGVAIMPYFSHGERGPTFDDISSLHSLCQLSADGGFDLPLRIMTVSDGGAVVAFGITGGDVPSIDR